MKRLDWWKTAWLLLGIVAVGFYGWSLRLQRFAYAYVPGGSATATIYRIERSSDRVDMLVPEKGWLRMDNEEAAALQRALWNQ